MVGDDPPHVVACVHRYTYELHPEFQVFPTFGVVIPSGSLVGAFSIPNFSFNPMMLLHGIVLCVCVCVCV